MYRIKGFSLLVMVCLVLLAVPSASWSQTNFSVKIYASDGTGWSDSVIIGKNTASNANVNSRDSLSLVLDEKEQPPLGPVGVADLRIVAQNGSGDYGQGREVDLRRLTSDAQRDVYRLSFRKSTEGSVITLSWQANIGSASPGGGFYLVDPFTGGLIYQYDMTTGTSYSHASWTNINGAQADIVVGDGQKLRTLPLDSIAMAKDSKGKAGKSEDPKRKGSGSEAQFTFLNATGGDVDGLYAEYSQKIADVLPSSNPFPTPNEAGQLGLAKITYSGATVANNGTVVVKLWGDKAKQLQVKKWWWLVGATITGGKQPTKLPDGGTDRLRSKMPNVNNIGEEMYAQAALAGIDPVNGIVVGIKDTVGLDIKGKPMYKYVYHPKWKDLNKTLNKGGAIFQNGAAKCLTDIAGKVIVKAQKALPPDKFSSKLLGQLVALKVNIHASNVDKLPNGFGDLIWNDPNDPSHPYNNQSIMTICLKADSALSCKVGNAGLKGGWTVVELADFLERLNGLFNGSFDTLSFGNPYGSKTNATRATGIKAICMVPEVHRTSLAIAPVNSNFDAVEYYNSLPTEFKLNQNYPNPFNPTTQIEFTLPEDAFVTLKVYNMLGQEIATLIDREEMTEGSNSVEFAAEGLATGVYYYRLVVNEGQFQQVKKMLLMK